MSQLNLMVRYIQYFEMRLYFFIFLIDLSTAAIYQDISY